MHHGGPKDSSLRLYIVISVHYNTGIFKFSYGFRIFDDMYCTLYIYWKELKLEHELYGMVNEKVTDNKIKGNIFQIPSPI